MAKPPSSHVCAAQPRRFLHIFGIASVVAGLLLSTAIARQTAPTPDATNVCPPGSFSGRAVSTTARGLKRFMMVSAYHLEPYSPAYLDNVLADLGRQQIAGIVYTALGEISSFLRKKGSSLDELELNRDIYERAKAQGANVWLQMRVYGNQLQTASDPQPHNYTAEEILAQPEADQAFRERVREEFGLYNKYFAGSCTVIVFEEAGIYHTPQSGGRFWSSEPSRIGKPNDYYDQMFVDRMTGIFAKVREEIKHINPSCSIGMHLGHSVFNNEPVLQSAMDHLRAIGAKPDFIFYDFYLKSQPNFDAYAEKLARRASFITKALKLPAYHLAQLHTMNDFQHGLGKTLSKDEIDRIVDLSVQLGFSGVGFYSKNAAPTSDDSGGAFDANTRGQGTVYETSKDRWDYGVLKLREIGGVDFRHRFDLVVTGAREGRLLAKNVLTNRWELIGDLNDARAKRGSDAVFRELDASRYLTGRALLLKIDGGESLSEDAAYALPSEPSKTFLESEELANKTAMQHSRAAAQARATPVDRADGAVTVCAP